MVRFDRSIYTHDECFSLGHLKRPDTRNLQLPRRVLGRSACKQDVISEHEHREDLSGYARRLSASNDPR